MVFPGRRNNSSTIALAALEAGLHPVPAETANTPASVLENTTTVAMPVSIVVSADASSTVEPLGTQLSVPLSIPETESSSLPLEEHASIDVESNRTSGASLADATTLPNSSSSC
jgi:hypothetical protein